MEKGKKKKKNYVWDPGPASGKGKKKEENAEKKGKGKKGGGGKKHVPGRRLRDESRQKGPWPRGKIKKKVTKKSIKGKGEDVALGGIAGKGSKKRGCRVRGGKGRASRKEKGGKKAKEVAGKKNRRGRKATG